MWKSEIEVGIIVMQSYNHVFKQSLLLTFTKGWDTWANTTQHMLAGVGQRMNQMLAQNVGWCIQALSIESNISIPLHSW